MTKRKEIPTLEKEHQIIFPKCELLCKELLRQIDFIINTNKIILAFPIQFRAKRFESIKNKIESGRYSVKNSILELQDLAGLRIITLFKRDAKNIIALLEKEFNILINYNTEDKLDDSEFGYSSTHLVCELKNEWLSLPSFSELSKIKFEIQIRTISQHSWAEVSNKLQYKQDESVPKPLKRSISRISALLEIVDSEFENLLQIREKYITNINIETFKTENEKLNVDNLKEILDKKLPSNFKIKSDNFSELLDNLITLGYQNSNDLILLIDDQLQNAIKKNTEICNEFRRNYETVGSAKSDSYHIDNDNDEEINRVLSGTFFSQVGLIRKMLEIELGGNIYRIIAQKKN